MRIKPAAIVQLNRLERRPLREADNRDHASLADYYLARCEALEREKLRLEQENARLEKFALARFRD